MMSLGNLPGVFLINDTIRIFVQRTIAQTLETYGKVILLFLIKQIFLTKVVA